jgi:hypothetical protein
MIQIINIEQYKYSTGILPYVVTPTLGAAEHPQVENDYQGDDTNVSTSPVQ